MVCVRVCVRACVLHSNPECVKSIYLSQGRAGIDVAGGMGVCWGLFECA